MSDTHYREFVERFSNADKATEVILNRSSEHAAVVIEFLMRGAVSEIDILTNELAVDVYGTPGVISAAIDFLRRNETGIIKILVETKIDTIRHPFFESIERAGGGARLSARFVPAEDQKAYKFNFAVADGKAYRFEESRNSRDAIVQFGDPEFGRTLQSTFNKVWEKAVERVPA